jgi:hypothetical protein
LDFIFMSGKPIKPREPLPFSRIAAALHNISIKAFERPWAHLRYPSAMNSTKRQKGEPI